MAEKTLVKKLAEIMGNIGAVEKTGFNNFNKYKYTTEADVQAITSKKMAKANLMLIPYEVEHEVKEVTTRKGNIEHLYTGTWDFSVIDGDTGEELAVRVSGQGQDSGDKAAFKALTGAHKYALMKLFQISTGDDPERDEDNNPTPQPNNNRQNNAQPNYQQPPQNYNNQPNRQQNQPQQQGPDVTAATVDYVKKLTGMGIDIQQVYAYIAQKEGVQSITEVDKVRVFGYIKAQYLKIKNNHQPQQTQTAPPQQNYEQGSVLQERTTQPANVVNWGNK